MLETNVLFRKSAIHNSKLKQLSDSDIREVQLALLDMLKDLDYVCRKYHLNYCLCGGSALGAVRHGGYIPWDDDIDVDMPRKDYDRLERLMIREFGDKYWVQNIKSSPAYDLSFMKIRKKGTRFVEIFESEPEYAGLFLDIYPIENTYNHPVLRFCQGMIVQTLLFCASCVRIHQKEKILLDYMSESKIRRVIKIKNWLGKKLGIFPMWKWLLFVEKWASRCKDENSRYIVIPSGRKHFWGELYKREVFFPFRQVSFEAYEFWIMNQPEVYLTKLFGDYMYIPSENEREKHSVAELDLGN